MTTGQRGVPTPPDTSARKGPTSVPTTGIRRAPNTSPPRPTDRAPARSGTISPPAGRGGTLLASGLPDGARGHSAPSTGAAARPRQAVRRGGGSDFGGRALAAAPPSCVTADCGAPPPPSGRSTAAAARPADRPPPPSCGRAPHRATFGDGPPAARQPGGQAAGAWRPFGDRRRRAADGRRGGTATRRTVGQGPAPGERPAGWRHGRQSAGGGTTTAGRRRWRPGEGSRPIGSAPPGEQPARSRHGHGRRSAGTAVRPSAADPHKRRSIRQAARHRARRPATALPRAPSLPTPHRTGGSAAAAVPR